MPSEPVVSTPKTPAMNFDHELSPEDLCRNFDSQVAGFETTEQIRPVDGIIGQERVVAALRMGLGIQDTGFNIFVSGMPGTGKMTAVRLFLEEFAQSKEIPPDWIYVNNFDDPSQSNAVRLPAGLGRQFEQDMRLLVDRIRLDIQRAFESDEYSRKRDEITSGVSQQRESALDHLLQQATDAGFALRPTSFGFVILPVREGRPLEDVEFATLPAAQRADFRRRRERLEEELTRVINQLRQPQREANENLAELNRQVAMFIVGEDLDELREKYRSLPEVVQYLTAVHEDILEDIKAFKSLVLPGYQESVASLPWLQEVPSRKYEVNLLVDNAQQAGAPVVVELNPTYNNLFGRIEKESHLGTLYTDFTLVRPGAIHRANGGYLVLPVEEVLQNLFSWDGLKRALSSNRIEVEEPAERLGFTSGKSLRPQSIPLRIKVVLMGRPLIYHLLHAYDVDFPELFKVKADFDIHMEATDENIQSFVGLISTLCQRYRLKPLGRGAVARVLEHHSRMCEDKQKLSTHFGALADVLKEAHFWAAQENAEPIDIKHVQKALDEKVHRSNLIKEHIQEMVRRGTLLVDITGQAIGQVNGISVMNLGDYMFGRPSRITATAGPGGQGIVDIEREVELGGAVHSKGVLIIGGYLTQKYAQDMVLILAGRLVFEQSYEGVEGDSASGAELFAILSVLSGLPIKQGIAVTGSVNQHGEIQPIGAVNEKVEGFYEVCKAQGLTGEQGVIIPQGNVQHLMLSQEVVQDVREGKFHIWAIKNVDEGTEVLTGVPAGERIADGEFTPDTVNYLVQQRLGEFAEYLKEFPEMAFGGPGAGTGLRPSYYAPVAIPTFARVNDLSMPQGFGDFGQWEPR